MQRISRLITNASGVPLTGLRARVTRLGGNSPCAYSLTDGGLLIKDGNARTDSTGKLVVYISERLAGCRITVYQADGVTIGFQEDVFTAFEASGVVASDSDAGSAPVVIPARIALGIKTATVAALATQVVDVILINSDGTITRNPSSGVTAASDDTNVATVVAATRTITGVAAGSATITFTYTSGAIVLTDTIAITVPA